MMHVLYVCGWQNQAHMSSYAWLSVSQCKILLNVKFLKCNRNLLEEIGISLKTVLSLAVPNQCCQAVMKGN